MLYATCTLTPGALAPYADVDYTPHLDGFASEGVVFQRHQSESGQSGISFASIFSGCQSDRHGIYDHPNQLSEELYLVTEAFRDAGYEPWYWSGHSMASYDLGYGQGVASDRVFVADAPRKREKLWSFLQPENPLMEELLAKLDADPEYRAFVLCNFTVTHGKYQRQIPDAEYDRFLAEYPEAALGFTRGDLEEVWRFYDEHRFDLQWGYPELVSRLGLTDDERRRIAEGLEVTYRADVAYLDGMFGRTLDVLRARGLLADSLIAFTADHGETFDREGTLFKWTHGLQLAPEVLAVPWILRSPFLGLEPGVYDGVTRSIDVYPTLAGLCGIDLAGRGVVGADLSGVLRGREGPPEDMRAWSHTTKIGARMVADFSRWSETKKYFASDDVDRIWVRLVEDGEEGLVFKWRNFGDDRWGAQAFDPERDPLELTDVFDPDDPEHVRAAELLQAYKARLEARFRGGGSTDAPQDSLDRLRELGYVEGGTDEDE